MNFDGPEDVLLALAVFAFVAGAAGAVWLILEVLGG